MFVSTVPSHHSTVTLYIISLLYHLIVSSMGISSHGIIHGYIIYLIVSLHCIFHGYIISFVSLWKYHFIASQSVYHLFAVSSMGMSYLSSFISLYHPWVYHLIVLLHCINHWHIMGYLLLVLIL